MVFSRTRELGPNYRAVKGYAFKRALYGFRLVKDFKEAYPDEGNVAVITGATSGIGKEIAKAVSKAGFHLLLPVRDREKGRRVAKEISEWSRNDHITLLDCDLTDFEAVKRCAEAIKATNLPIHLLINNAGVFASGSQGGSFKTSLEPNMAINYLSQYIFTESLLEATADKRDKRSIYGTRIINVTSSMFYAIAKLDPENFRSAHFWERFSPYARSKYAQVLYTMELARKLMPVAPKTTVNVAEPGMVQTDIYRYQSSARLIFKGILCTFFPFFLGSAQEGALTTIWLALSNDVHGVTGRVFGDLREIPMGTSVGRYLENDLGRLSAQTDIVLLQK